MTKIPFPEHLFNDNPKLKEFVRGNWADTIDDLTENMENSLGIKTRVIENEKGEISVEVTTR